MNTGLAVFGPNDDRIVFWLSWIFLVSQFPQKLVDKYILKYEISRENFMRFYLVFMVFGGIAFWKLLQKRRFVRIRNVIVGLQGFFLFHLFLFAVWLGLFLVLNMTIHEVTLKWTSSASGIMLFYLATFLGGCWIGHKNERLTYLWCGIGVIALYYGITLRLASFHFADIWFVILSILISMLGGYVGKRYLPVPMQHI